MLPLREVLRGARKGRTFTGARRAVELLRADPLYTSDADRLSHHIALVEKLRDFHFRHSEQLAFDFVLVGLIKAGVKILTRIKLDILFRAIALLTQDIKSLATEEARVKEYFRRIMPISSTKECLVCSTYAILHWQLCEAQRTQRRRSFRLHYSRIHLYRWLEKPGVMI